jgi:peptidoglycan glycosyltransferase
VNGRIRRLAAALLVLYVVLFVQLNVLQIGAAERLNTDSRNNRATVRDFNDPRGDIVSADGVVVATSFPTDSGSEFAYQRVYPTGELFANVTGYYTFVYGSTQLERTQNDVLAGRTTEQQLRGLAALFGGGDTSGDVITTVDSRLQDAARQALGEREGSVVVLDVETGAILAMWSWPSYDPNLVAVHDNELAGNVIRFLDAVPGKPLLANAYQERYMPGSAFKVVTTAIALDAGLITPESEWADEREWLPPQTTDPIQNYRGTVCGGNLFEVFRRSCNTPFARIAAELGPATMVSGTQAFGIGEPLPIDLPRPAASVFGEVSDFVDAVPKLAISGFGQDEVQIVPLHMAMIAASVANGGVMMAPYVVDRTLDNQGRVLDVTEPSVWKTPMTPGTAELLTQMMVGVVQSGTASCCLQLQSGVQVAAKTGTAQLNAAGEPERSHAWIMGFAPAEAPKYAFAVVLKGTTAEISAGTGGTLAGPVARQVLDAAFANGVG